MLTVLALVASLCAVMVAPAGATAAAITLDPTSGLPGINVTTVTGTGFPADTAGILSAPGVIAEAGFTTDAAGAIPATLVTIIAGAPVGPQTITATVGDVTATAEFNVEAPIYLTLTTGLPGITTNVTGTDFPAATAGTLTATPAGVIVPVSFTTTADGAILATPVTILPDATPGPATFTATVGDVTGTATFTVTGITLTPTAGLRGSTVTVAGFGFAGNVTVALSSEPVTVIETIPPFKTNLDGTFSKDVTIATGALIGPVTIGAIVDVAPNHVTVTAPFMVEAPLTLTPIRGLPGSRVRVIGANFPADAPGLLTAPGVIDPVAFTTGGTGQIALIVTILPGARAGDHDITATVGVVEVSRPFEVTVRPAALALSPRSGLPGAEVTATGVRFPPNAPGMVVAPGIISPVTFMTTAAGAIPATVITILPGAAAGVQVIEAIVGDVSDTAAFTVLEVDIPHITLAPDEGGRGSIVAIAGSNFPTGSPGVITAPGIVAPVVFTTDPDGVFATTVTIRGAAPFGLATITATVGVVSDGAHFVVLPPVAPSITLSPTSGSPRTVVTVTGVAFRPNTAGVIVGPGVMHPIGFTTDAVGAIPATNVTILSGAPFGAASITATVGVESDDATFTVRSPAIVISPPGGVRGADVRIPVARGFPINAEGMITSPGVISPVSFATDAAGNLDIPIAPSILLDAPLGEATFTATVTVAGVTTQATATYIVGITPTITISPTIGFEGTEVTVTGHGFPDGMSASITSPNVLHPFRYRPIVDDYGRIPSTDVTILTGAPVGAATITVAVGDYSATAVFAVAGPGVPVIVPEPIVPVLEGLADVWDLLGKSVLEFRDGNWYRHHTVPEKHELIPEAHRLAELKSGGAYWIYLIEDITDVMIGGVLRTLPAGWHNIGWVL